MKKLSLLFLIVLSFTMASCLGENQIEGISCTGFKTQYFVGEEIDTSGIRLNSTFESGKTDVLELKNVTVDTSKAVSEGNDNFWNGTDAVSIAAAGDAGAGVSTPVVAVAVVAVIALAGAAICMKKRTVTE